MISGFFDSEVIGIDDENMPIFDRAQSSAVFAKFYESLISNGVLAYPTSACVATPGGGMSIHVTPFFAMIRGYFGYEEDAQEYTLEPAPSSGGRIDRFIIKYSGENREITAFWRTGVVSQTPQPPALVRTSDIHEISPFRVRVNAGVAQITASDIIDDRGDASVCGFVTCLVDRLDISMILSRFESDFRAWENTTESDFEAWKTNSEDDFETWSTTRKNDFAAWMLTQQTEFNDWFDALQVHLDDNVAANHERRIIALESGGERRVASVLETVMWQGNVYSFEGQYPASQYDVQVEVNGDLADSAAALAWTRAIPVGSMSENKITAFGNVPTVNIPVVLTVSMKKDAYVQATMFRTGWVGNAYSFESEYPSDGYNITIEPNGDLFTAAQQSAWSLAVLVGCMSENKVIALGDVPTVDIPVIVKVVKK